ncbi:MAG: hypothetical protein EXR39_05600 [Betaproteobacteria bacterium]|nr:hypothetical protein [Betaproteobacteria bacterium]
MRTSPTARAARYTVRKGYLHLLTTQIHERLTERYRLLNTEIHSYPGPIAHCDLQLTHLLEERQRIMKALAEWPLGNDRDEAALGQKRFVLAFLDTPADIDDAIDCRLRTRARKTLRMPEQPLKD